LCVKRPIEPNSPRRVVRGLDTAWTKSPSSVFDSSTQSLSCSGLGWFFCARDCTVFERRIMEGLPNGSANAINTTVASYPSPSAASPHLPPQQHPHHSHHAHHHQAQTSAPPHTLPPLQPSNPVMQQGPYGSYPHTPRTPATPNTPSSTGTMASYPPPPPQNAGRANAYPIMGNNTYQQQPYPGASSSVMPQSTTAASHPQPIAPAPATAGNRAPPVLRPMPAGGVMSQPGMNPPYSQSPLMPQMTDGDPPTHVVGSQGRRGILPSAPGRPAAPAAGSAQAKNQIPQKDADGKFPCPHCTKTYLHAKHLKRHLLRRKSCANLPFGSCVSWTLTARDRYR
jgi:hypothetical protein